MNRGSVKLEFGGMSIFVDKITQSTPYGTTLNVFTWDQLLSNSEFDDVRERVLLAGAEKGFEEFAKLCDTHLATKSPRLHDRYTKLLNSEVEAVTMADQMIVDYQNGRISVVNLLQIAEELEEGGKRYREFEEKNKAQKTAARADTDLSS